MSRNLIWTVVTIPAAAALAIARLSAAESAETQRWLHDIGD